MTKKKFTVLLGILFIGFLRIALIFTHPSEASLPQIDPNQIGYIGLLQNPVIHLLFCLSFIIMLVGFHYAFTNLELETNKGKTNNIFILIAGLVGIAMIILWYNWSYISSQFLMLSSMLAYEAYNPQSAPNQSYYQWKYSLNPAKVTIVLLFIPIFLPMFYYLKNKLSK
ncbi:hypothetical protein [Legionella longbeachae]|uniref:hypothetical protein n=1 Tax=Legionella longbeachae TaxID=450 RepID=UPI0009B74A22|nr:hypothetical protein [Legionella longbeachae]VEE02772.1 Uncharacterised protein [Legionella oakridgensis]HBD7397955.1 hypothetical protein [Legionella pneumophila]ARB90980.1 hypothetical protein A6J40_01680 [Legionella longbeachae]ARM32593.1 hypothetical protein B0B39_03240 [Legionella longbeachae]QIN32523.1 hypothetical protein GCB94_10400 [Legionella longbeachae]